MEKNSKRVISKLELCCYIIAAVFVACAIYMTWASMSYLTQSIAAYGMSLGDVWSDVVQLVISGFVPYFAYAVLVFCAGKIIGILQVKCCEETCCCEEDSEGEVSEDGALEEGTLEEDVIDENIAEEAYSVSEDESLQ